MNRRKFLKGLLASAAAVPVVATGGIMDPVWATAPEAMVRKNRQFTAAVNEIMTSTDGLSWINSDPEYADGYDFKRDVTWLRVSRRMADGRQYYDLIESVGKRGLDRMKKSGELVFIRHCKQHNYYVVVPS